MSQIIDRELIFTKSTGRDVTGFDDYLTVVQDASTHSLQRITLLKMFIECSTVTGGYVHINPQLGCLPALIGSDNEPIYLYEFVEVLDGLIDYDAITEEFPTLTYAQIGGALAFLRKTAQFNARGVDIDALEDEADANDPELINALRVALNDRETSRVLHND
ncbi:MAG TPA: hypothetical protein VEZ40_11615 [Pyrinomonadaceae bacterium]|nr:hypothetical protein [Pyrinomonadaceae bacterium]